MNNEISFENPEDREEYLRLNRRRDLLIARNSFDYLLGDLDDLEQQYSDVVNRPY